MGLPLYLAMTGAEISAMGTVPHPAWMACHFSPYDQGLTNLPRQLPEGSMLILNDRVPCQGHSPSLVAQQMQQAAQQFGCSNILLDFQRPVTDETAALTEAVLDAAPCPVAISEPYAGDRNCIVFLSPCPLHIPLSEYLAPWNGRELWMEAALCQEKIQITPQGADISAHFPPSKIDSGLWDPALCCGYRTELLADSVCFTLFDTPEGLLQKLELARSLGITLAVGLYQQLWKYRDLFFPSLQNG